MSGHSSATVYVSTHGRFLLAFCADCSHFVAASTELGAIAIATRAHRCDGRIRHSRKRPAKADLADRWLKTSGAMA
jgi:hypothetical protein